MELAVLDQTPIYESSDPMRDGGVSAVREAVQLARDCEALGWDRFWVAEHHEMSKKSGGCGSPEILVSAIGSATSLIRVGTAAVLLPHYAPLKVATTFNVLGRLYPDRIDLGVGRGPGGSPAAISRLASLSTQSYSSKILELMQYLNLERGPINQPTFLPPTSSPQVFVNGSSAGGAAVAAAHGLPFVLAQFAHPQARPDLVKQYREAFRPSLGRRPFVGVGMWITCTDDAKDADRLRSELGGFSEEIGATSRKNPQAAIASPERNGVQALIGTPAQIEPRLTALLDLYRPDLLAVTTFCPDYNMRLRSYELVRQLASSYSS